MKTNLFQKFLLLLLAVGVISIASCKDDDPTPLTLASLMAGSIDLNGATAATNVPINSNIVATFSADVDMTTATTSTITLSAGSTNVTLGITTSGSTVTLDPNNDLWGGAEFTLTFNGLKSTDGEVMTTKTVTFKTAGIGLSTPPQASSQVLYLQLNGDITDITGNATQSYAQVSYTADRFGYAGGAAIFNGATSAGNGDIVELSGSQFVTPSTTISVWFKAALDDYTAGSKIMFGIATERGYFMEMGGEMNWMKFATSHMVSPDPNNHYFGTAWTDPNGDGQTNEQVLYDYNGSIQNLVKDNWHQLVMTHDAASSVKTIYVDGVKVMQVDLDVNATEWGLKDLKIADKADGTGEAIAGIDPKLTLGFMCSRNNTATGWSNYAEATNTFKGALDDFRIFNKALTESEVTTFYNAEKP